MLNVDRCVKLAAALLLAGLSGCGDSDRAEWGKSLAPSPTGTTRLSSTRDGVAELPGRLPSTLILEPRAGSEVGSPVIEVSGVFNPPPNHLEAFVVTRDPFNWYVQWPPVRIDRRTGAFSQENVRIATPGRWEVHVVIATPEAGRLFHEHNRGDWGGMACLPAGTASAASVSVRQVDRTQAGR